MPNHAFISYVRDNSEQVDRICEPIQASGVDVWLDRNRIAPGMRWEDAIRQAIRQGACFVACFSHQYWERQSTYMNTELGIAIDELSKRRNDQAWFIPVRLDDCEIPDKGIGAGETLQNLQSVDLFRDWADGMDLIIRALAPFADDEFRSKARLWVAEERKTDRALHIYDEWHSPLIHESRIQVSNFIECVREKSIAKLPTLTDFEISQRSTNELTPYADHFFRIVHFFERWALIRSENLLDQSLAVNLLGSYAPWYRDHLMKPIADGERNPDFVRLITLIREMLDGDDFEQHSTDCTR